MPRRTINPSDLWDSAPRSYSHVVRFDDPREVIFLAGQGPLEADLTVIGDDIETQARATFENVKIELEHAGASMRDVVDLTVYVSDIAEHQRPVREVRKEFFEPDGYPVSTMIEIGGFAIDGIMIEIDAIAIR